ncbi:hypothetical protein ABPG72_012400 [Tetrahymena utriculariae]
MISKPAHLRQFYLLQILFQYIQIDSHTFIRNIDALSNMMIQFQMKDFNLEFRQRIQLIFLGERFDMTSNSYGKQIIFPLKAQFAVPVESRAVVLIRLKNNL